jgi:hypothetical protein
MRGVLKADLHGILQILPARGSLRLTLASLSKQVLKDVTEATPAFAKLEIAHIEIREVRPVEPTART